MVKCPRCERSVDRLHPIPPETLTKDLLAVVGFEEGAVDPEACQDCIDELMEA